MTERKLIQGEFYGTAVGAPPDGWTPGHATLTLKSPDDRVAIEAWRSGAFAIHEVRFGWHLTHVPTGLRIWTFDTPELAAECAQRIRSFADFDAIKEKMPKGSDLYPRVRAVIDEIEQRDMA